jgi:hypothetical protein
VYREDLRIGLAASKPHNGCAMRKFFSMCLLLCPAGMVHATVLYDNFTDEVPSNTVSQQVPDTASTASNYALEISMLDFRQPSAEPDWGPLQSGQKPQGLVDGINYTWTAPRDNGITRASVAEGGDCPVRSSKGEPATLGIAGFALIGVGWLRRPVS